MNYNNLLKNTSKILNITNKALPLIKDVSPTIKAINNKIKQKPIKNNKTKKTITNSNSLTFFK